MTRVGGILPEVMLKLFPASVISRRANWSEVARVDLEDVRRSWVLWTLGGAFAVLMLLAPLRPMLTFPGSPADVPVFFGIVSLNTVIWLLAPLAGLLVGATAVVAEREAGSLRVLLGQPVTRREVVVGKLLARSVVLAGVLLVGFGFAGVELWFVYGQFDLVEYSVFVGTRIGYGLLFVWIGVGLSAFVRSQARAVGAAVSTFVLVVHVWRVIPKGAFYLVNGQFPESVPPPWDPPAWFVFLGNANPFYGYFSFVGELPLGNSPWIGFGATSTYRGYSIDGSLPFYLQPAFLLVVMLVWVIVPLLLGTWRFSRSDLA